MPRKQLEKVLVAELGDTWRDRVADFEYDPLAAASIGQVCALSQVSHHASYAVLHSPKYPGCQSLLRMRAHILS